MISEQVGQGTGWDATVVAEVIDYMRRARQTRLGMATNTPTRKDAT